MQRQSGAGCVKLTRFAQDGRYRNRIRCAAPLLAITLLVVNRHLSLLLAMVLPVQAQRPTAAPPRAPISFWPLDAASGTVVFAGPAAHPGPTLLANAEHLRAWLTGAGVTWSEYQSGNDSTLLFRGQLAGAHPGVVLAFALRARLRTTGFYYRLALFEVAAPNGEGFMHWMPLRIVGNNST